VTGYNVCYHHGANPKNRGGGKKGTPKPAGAGGPAWGNLNGLKHGAYTIRLLPDEQPYFEAIKAEFEKELGGADTLSAADRLLIFRLAVNAAKMTVATEKGAEADAIVTRHRIEMDLLRELKATRATKNEPTPGGNSPAEVVAALLMKVREHALATQRAPALPQESGDGVVIECEVVDNGGDADA